MSPDIQIPESQAMAIDMQEQNMSQLAQVGVAARDGMAMVANLAAGILVENQNLITKAYLKGLQTVTLPEALGAREVGSEKNPGGPSKPGTT